MQVQSKNASDERSASERRCFRQKDQKDQRTEDSTRIQKDIGPTEKSKTLVTQDVTFECLSNTGNVLPINTSNAKLHS